MNAITDPGVYEIPEALYNADPCADVSLRSSVAWRLVDGRSKPAHVRLEIPRLNPGYVNEPRKHFDLGKACHKLLLGKGAVICDIPGYGYAKNEGKHGPKAGDKQDLRDAAHARGEIPLQAHEREQAEAMAKSARQQLCAYAEHNGWPAVPFSGDVTERTIVWRQGGILCRAMLDGLPDDSEAIDEYKTDGESADESAFRWKARRFGYFFRMAFYRGGLEKLQLAYSPHFRFFVQETFAPYLMNFIPVDDEVIEREHQRVIQAVKLWNRCTSTGLWPGFPLEGQEASLTERERMAEQTAPGAGHVSSDDIAYALK